jgi:hypothetical protein
LKYDAGGNEVWVGLNGFTLRKLAKVAIDAAGNVYVTGSSWGGNPGEGGTSHDYATVKYDPEGQALDGAIPRTTGILG